MYGLQLFFFIIFFNSLTSHYSPRYYCRDVISILSLSDDSLAVEQAALRDKPDILVSTPSRLVAHLKAGNIVLRAADAAAAAPKKKGRSTRATGTTTSDMVGCDMQTLIVDEADLVLSFGHSKDVRGLTKYMPKVCQCFLMSATLSPDLRALQSVLLHSPVILKLEEGSGGHLTQCFVLVPKKDRNLLAYALLQLQLLATKVCTAENESGKQSCCSNAPACLSCIRMYASYYGPCFTAFQPTTDTRIVYNISRTHFTQQLSRRSCSLSTQSTRATN
jgi:hypothetical protein